MRRKRQHLTLFAFLVFALVGAIVWAILETEWHPQPSPLPLPTQSLRVRSYETFLPLAYRPASKKGIGLTYGHCEDAQRVGASWFYTWGPWLKDCAGAESVPMIWGANDIGKTPRGTSVWLLGFNEPDRSNQANMEPLQAAALWREVERLYGADWKLVSPAVSHTAVDWLLRFVGAYLELYGHMPQLDALALHCYANSVAQCVATVEEAIELANRWGVLGGVWVTEFAFWPVEGEEVGIALDKARQMIEALDGELGVVRYAWFAARMRGDEWWMGPSTALVEFDGSTLTAYGEMYKEE